MFDVSAKGSVPQAVTAFLDSEDLEDAIRLGVSIGGDADTIASIAGAIAEAYYKEVPREIEQQTITYLDQELTEVLEEFEE